VSGNDTKEAGESTRICDPEIDAEAIMRQIRETIRKQRIQAEAQGADYEALIEGICTSQATARFDRSLYDALQRMSVSYDKIGVGPLLTGSSIPIVAPLVRRIRMALHQLVIYYVNELAGQQVRFNEHVVRATAMLIKGLEEDRLPGEVDTLRQEIAQLRAEVERFRAMGSRDSEQKDKQE